jgi:hypothetical protein
VLGNQRRRSCFAANCAFDHRCHRLRDKRDPPEPVLLLFSKMHAAHKGTTMRNEIAARILIPIGVLFVAIALAACESPSNTPTSQIHKPELRKPDAELKTIKLR